MGEAMSGTGLDPLTLMLGLAISAGMDLPLLLLLPWLLSLVPGVGPAWVESLGGLASPLPAALGAVLLLLRRLLRGIPWAASSTETLLGGAGVLASALLPWLLTPAGDGAGWGTSGWGTAVEAGLSAGVTATVVLIRLGSLALERHAPGFHRVPGTRALQGRLWPWLPAASVAAVLLVALVLLKTTSAPAASILPGAAFLVFLVAFLALLLIGWQGLRTGLALLLEGWRRWVLPHRGSGRGASRAALLGDGPSGVRWGVLRWPEPSASPEPGEAPDTTAETGAGEPTEPLPVFRFRSLGGSWEMQLGPVLQTSMEPGSLLGRVAFGDVAEQRFFLTSRPVS